MSPVVNASAPRVLILSASYGSGHNAAAWALKTALRRAGAHTRVVDHFYELVHPTFDRGSRLLYDFLIYRAPWLWELAYWIGDLLPTSSGLLFGMSTLGTARLRALLDSFQPAVVYTDFAVHSQWLPPLVDLYCVPAEGIRDLLIARGVEPERVLTTGLPVRPEFEEPADQAVARQALGLDLDRP